MVAPTCFGITLRVVSSDNILSTDPQLNISHKALGTIPKDDNVMPKHVGATVCN
jgi:hypothetical protein